MWIKVVAVCYVALFTGITEAKEFARCEVAKKLAVNGFPRSFLPNCK